MATTFVVSLHTLILVVLVAVVSPLRPQIPSVRSFTEATQSAFTLTAKVQIIVDPVFQHVGSPSLLDYAQTFRTDLSSITGFNLSDIIVRPRLAEHSAHSIFLTLGPSTNHTLFNGESTGEGYDFEITPTSYVIQGAKPIGAWWGTRTLLQQVALSADRRNAGLVSIPAGSGSDTPGWEVRGFMLDVGRHWFQPSFIADLCIYASFFKIQTLHLHASDNLWDPAFLYGKDWRNLYAGFRFQPAPGSSISGLVPLKNESWTETEFYALQATCSAHGVILVPEIDTPGHSLVITKWKPELMLPHNPDHLNLSHPDTIPTIKSIWDEFLPWFTAAEVSIGADEYDASLANEYISFVNDMSEHIYSRSGKSIRVWGTNEPSETLSISKNVTIQHWDFPGDSVPVRLMRRGYKVINSEQAFLYLDGKTSYDGQFPAELNQDLMWAGAPGGKGWAPNVFSRTDTSNNTSIDDPALRGAIMALWNDWGNNATTPLEIYYQLARSLAVFAEKTWAGSGARSSGLTREEFDRVYPLLNAAAPGQNLNRAVLSQPGYVVFQYENVSSPLRTSFDSVGPPYVLSFTVKPSNTTSPNDGNGGVLFSGRDAKLHAGSLSFEDPSTGIFYPLNYTLPTDRYTTVEIHATRDYTYAVIDGTTYWWTTYLDIWGIYMKAANMSFAAPSSIIHAQGFSGELLNVTLKLGTDDDVIHRPCDCS